MSDQILIECLRVQAEQQNLIARTAMQTAADRIEALVKERDELGRKLNTARYGQPHFAWSIHEEAMADLRAKLTKAVELALEECPFRAGTPKYDKWWHHRRAALAELEGGE